MRTTFSLLLGVSLALAGCNDNDENAIGPISGEIPAGIFQATLSRLDEVPRCPNESKLSMGNALVTLSLDERVLLVEHVEFAYLSSPATAAHIQVGPPGVAGPVIFTLAEAPTSPLVGLAFTADHYPSPVPAGAPATFADFVDALVAGGTYVSVSTRECPGGEIRGQLGVATVENL